MRKKAKAKNKPQIGFQGVRWCISRGAPRRVRVTTVGETAFIHPTRGKRAEMIDASRLFETEHAAIQSMKFKLGWMADRHDEKAIPIKHHRDDSGNVLVYDRKGNHVHHYGQPLFETKREALKALVNQAQNARDELQKRLRKADALVQRLQNQFTRA